MVQIPGIQQRQTFPGFAAQYVFCDKATQTFAHLQRIHAQKLAALTAQHFFWNAAVSGLPYKRQRVFNPRFQTLIAVSGPPHGLRHLVCRTKANAVHFRRQAVRIVLQHLLRKRAIDSKNFAGIGAADAVHFQKQHQFPLFGNLTIGIMHGLRFFLANAVHFSQPFRRGHQYIQRPLPKALHHPSGQGRPNAFDNARSQKTLNPFDAGRSDALQRRYLELPAKTGMLHPFTARFHSLAH